MMRGASSAPDLAVFLNKEHDGAKRKGSHLVLFGCEHFRVPGLHCGDVRRANEQAAQGRCVHGCVSFRCAGWPFRGHPYQLVVGG